MAARASIARALGVLSIAALGLVASGWFVDRIDKRGALPAVEFSEPTTIANPVSIDSGSVRTSARGEVDAEPERLLPVLAAAAAEDAEWVGDLVGLGGLPIRVLDGARAPIPGALIEMPEHRVWPISETDEDGFVLLPVGETRPSRLFVRAFAYEPAEIEVPQSLSGPLMVVLHATSGVRVRVLAGRPEWLDGLHIGLMGQEGLFEAPDYGAGRAELADAARRLSWEGGWAPQREAGSDGRTEMAVFELDDVGEVEIDGLIPSVGIELGVLDAYGNLLVREELPVRVPGRVTGIAVSVPGVPHTFEGHVVDAGRQGVPDAKVALSGTGLLLGDRTLFLRQNERPSIVSTDAEGRFSFEALWGDTATVAVTDPDAEDVNPRWGVTKARHVWKDVDLRVPAELVLEAGRSFRVYLEGMDGSPSAVWLGAVNLEVEPLAPFSGGLEPGVGLSFRERPHFAVSGAPPVACRVRIALAGRAYEETVAADQTEVALALPAHGALTVRVTGSVGGETSEHFRVLAERVAEEHSPVLLSSELRTDGQAPVRFSSLLPGEYEIWVVRKEGNEPLSAHVPVTIQSGETASIDIALLD